MATESLAGQIPIELVSMIDTLDTTSKLIKTLQLKLICAWKHLSEMSKGDYTEAIDQFVRLLPSAHKQLWEVDQTLVNWYQTQFLTQCKNTTAERALKSFVTDSDYKSLKTSIWGSRVITDMKAPKAAKKIATRETVSIELPPLFDSSKKELTLELEENNPFEKEIDSVPFKKVELSKDRSKNTLSLDVLDLRVLEDPNKKVLHSVNAESPALQSLADLNTDFERKKISYFVQNGDKGGIVYYLPLSKDSSTLTEYKINKPFTKGFVHPSDQGPVAVFQLSSKEVCIFRPDIQNPRGPGVWGENLNKNKSRDLVAFEYRNQHGIILLKESEKLYAIFFNDKCEITLNDKSTGFIDTELSVPSSSTGDHLNTHIYFKPNGLPFPYFFNVFKSFVLVSFYSNSKGAAYVTIRSQLLTLNPIIESATWVWIACEKYGTEEALQVKVKAGSNNTKIGFIKF